MALRDWSGRRLARMWLAGVALEAILVLGPRACAPAEADLSPELRELRLHDDSVARGLARPYPQLTPSQRAAIRGLLRDSLGITWESRGGTTQVHLPPPLEQATTRAVSAIQLAMLPILLVLAAIYLPIPCALLALTAAWLIVRRRRTLPQSVPAA